MGRTTRVLIVDDEPSVLLALEMALRGAGWHVETAASADEGLRILEKSTEPFDALLLDKNLPGKSGLGLARDVRARSDEIRIILMTGYPSVDSSVEALNLGIDAYLEKPFKDIHEVRRTIDLVLRKRTQRWVFSMALAQRAAEHRNDPLPSAPAESAPAKPASPRTAAIEAAASVNRIAPTMPSMKSPRGAGRAPKAAPAEVTVAPSASRTPNAGSSGAPGRSQPQAAKLVVLVASRDPARASRVTSALDPSRDTIATAREPADVLAALAGAPADLVIVDGEAYEAELEALLGKVRDAAPLAACVVLSTRLSLDTVKKLMDLEVRALIEESPEAAAFGARVADLVGRARVRKRMRASIPSD